MDSMCLRGKVEDDFKSYGLSSWRIGLATFQSQKIRGTAGFWVGMEIIRGLAWERPSLRCHMEMSKEEWITEVWASPDLQTDLGAGQGEKPSRQPLQGVTASHLLATLKFQL